MSRVRYMCVLPVLAAVIVIALGGITIRGQGPSTPSMKAVVTSNSPLSLSTKFALPPGDAINDRGDFAFTAGLALFLRRAGATAPVRILQSGEPVPGVPHSLIDLIQAPRINQDGLVAFSLEYFDVGTAAMVGGIFTYDGVSLRKVALGTETAPDSGGVMFGRGIGLAGFNDKGDVAFTAPLIPVGSPWGTLANTTIFIAPAGKQPIRIAGPGDMLPDTGGTISYPVQGVPGPNPIAVSGFNNFGEVLFTAAITGGPGGFGVFAGSVARIRKIVANDDPYPGGGIFDLSTSTSLPSLRLNNARQVSLRMSSSDVLVSSPGNDPVLAVALATPLPAPLETRSLSNVSVAGFNDSGAMLLSAQLTGTSTNNFALLRYTGGPLEIVAYRGQAAPTSGQSFYSFSAGGVPFNNAGDVVFYSTLSPPLLTPRGYFKKPSGGSVIPVALNGDATPAGGNYNITSPWWRLLGDGSVYYESNILGGPPSYGAFLARAAAGTEVLVTDGDPLPDGAGVVLRTFFATGAGTYVGFNGRRAGGPDSYMVHNVATGVTSTIVKPGDPSPLPGNSPFTAVAGGNAVYVNASGDIVFSGTVAGVASLFVGSAAGAMQKLAGPGDEVPPELTSTFTACTLPGLLVPQINSAGKVAFKGAYLGGPGLFVAAAGGKPVKVVRNGDAAPTGGTFTSTFGNFIINDAGQVAFSASTSTGLVGVFVATPGSTPVKVAATGDNAPGGGTISAFTSPTPAGFNAAGEVAFYAGLNGGAGAGLFVGTAGGPVQAIALNGTAAPAGGNYAFTVNSKDVRINDAGDIFFQAPLGDGGAADSGYFLYRGSTGRTEAVALQGQVPLGTSYPLGTISGTLNAIPGELSALGPTGELVFLGPVDRGGPLVHGLFVYRGPGTLEKLILRGDTVPDSGGGIAGPSSQGVGAGALGLFFFKLSVVDGAFVDGMFALDTMPPTVSAMADMPVLKPPTGKFKPVTIRGSAADVGSGLAYTGGTYEVVDEYDLVKPQGTFTIGASGTFSFAVSLEAFRRGYDTDGRLYSVRVTVRDLCGNATTTTVNIVVPRDQHK